MKELLQFSNKPHQHIKCVWKLRLYDCASNFFPNNKWNNKWRSTNARTQKVNEVKSNREICLHLYVIKVCITRTHNILFYSNLILYCDKWHCVSFAKTILATIKYEFRDKQNIPRDHFLKGKKNIISKWYKKTLTTQTECEGSGKEAKTITAWGLYIVRIHELYIIWTKTKRLEKERIRFVAFEKKGLQSMSLLNLIIPIRFFRITGFWMEINHLALSLFPLPPSETEHWLVNQSVFFCCVYFSAESAGRK